MRNDNTQPATATPLLEILRQLGKGVDAATRKARRDEFATLAGTSTAYLYQLAGCNRGTCRASLAAQIEKASEAMHKKYGTNKITMRELACMCPLPERG